MSMLGDIIATLRPHALDLVAVTMLILGMLVAIDRVFGNDR